MKIFTISVFTALNLMFMQAGYATDTPKKGEISMKKAQELATKEVSGNIKSSEYEFEKGQNVYSFDIIASNGSIHNQCCIFLSKRK